MERSISWRERFARAIAPDAFDRFEDRVNVRAASIIAKMDPLEFLMQEFHGVFGEEYEHPEDKLDDRGILLMKTMGYQLMNDPSFEYFMRWVMNTQGNAMLKAPARTNEERGEVLLWGKAQIAGVMLIIKEAKRLNGLYLEILKKKDEDGPDAGTSVE